MLVRQYRYAYGESIYEIPAGKLDGAEDPKMAAARELEEEAGLKAGRLEHLFTIYPTPGYTNEKIYIYQAMNGKKVSAHLDEGEYVEVLEFTIDEFVNKYCNHLQIAKLK